MVGRPRTRTTKHALARQRLPREPGPFRLPKETPTQCARGFQVLLDSGQVVNRAELAGRLGCSRVWVTKVLNKRAG